MGITNNHLLIWILLMWLLSKVIRMQRPELIFGKFEWRYKPFFAILIFLPIFIMVVYGPLRYDLFTYMTGFKNLPSTISLGWREAVSSDRPGFKLFGIIIKQLFGEKESCYRFAIALVQAVPLVLVLQKYSDNYLFSIYVFITSTLHISWMMNGIRQFMAVTIIFAATPWIIQKKYIRTIIVILLAASFHKTALVMIPVIFIVQGKVWNWKTILYSIAIIGLTYVFAQNTGAFDTVASIAGYSMDVVRSWGDDGSNPVRVLVSAVPMIMAFVYRKRISAENNSLINICINMSVITTGINLVAMVTSGILTGRMPIYTSLYNLILLPYLLNNAFGRNQRRLVTIAAILLYYLFYLRLVT